MAIMRVHKTANYTIMSNYHFKEKGMSLKAKGLLSMMLSLPDDWDYSIMGLVQLSKDGKDSVMSALQELERFGYLTRTRLQGDDGKFAGYDYDIFEQPQSVKPNEGKPYAEKPNTENPPQLNTKEINAEGINIRKNQDELDKQDKRLSPSSGEFSTILSTNENPLTGVSVKGREHHDNVMSDLYFKPSAFTKELIKAGYIEEDDLQIRDYNHFLNGIYEDVGFEKTRSLVWYFVKRLYDGLALDERGLPIENKLAYFQSAIMNNVQMFKEGERDPYSDESINETLELVRKRASANRVS